MKRNQLIFILITLLTFLTACGPAATPIPPTLPPSTSPPPAPTETNPMASPTVGEVLLELVGIMETRSLTMADLQALSAMEGQAGIKTSTGRIFPPVAMKGVALAELAALVGGLDPSLGINVVAKDGYAMTFSYNQITQGNFVAYDPATGEERKMEEPLNVVLAYEREGQPISEDEGPLRLAVISSKNNQVTDGHWSVKWVNKIEIKNLGKEWSLELEGPMSAEIDRNSFQSCTAPGCHGATWKDNQAQNWVGVPLWLLAGYVDDEIKHDGPAFNDALADAGYFVEIVATDGYSVTLSSAEVKRNDKWILAFLVNENPLPDKYFPLRLVGDDLDKKQMVGAVANIHVILDSIPVTQATSSPLATPSESSAEPTGTHTVPTLADLIVNGAVENELILFGKDLRAMEVATITAEHPKQGSQEYEGVRLNDLLAQAVVKPGATKLIFTSLDGYSAQVDLALIAECADCLIAFTEEPCEFNLVMPGFESSMWVKQIVMIEVQ